MSDHDEFGEPMDGVEVLRLRDTRQSGHAIDDAAIEYSIRSVPEAIGGLIVYGLYRRGWVVNPSLRHVVRELMNCLGFNI